jgi:omega-6 fatty acid desaturase (delta-12 desaturase)
LVLFLVLNRIPLKKATSSTRRFTHITNFALLAMVVGMSFLIGWKAYLTLQLAVLFVGSASGVWLFYVQHQFEGVSWERGETWSFLQAALEGSSFYKLPRILQWFSGNIGYHHIHHLSPRIPNYNLEDCHHADPLFHEVEPLTLRRSIKSVNFRLWDEKSRKLVGYDHLRSLRRKAAPEPVS